MDESKAPAKVLKGTETSHNMVCTALSKLYTSSHFSQAPQNTFLSAVLLQSQCTSLVPESNAFLDEIKPQ